MVQQKRKKRKKKHQNHNNGNYSTNSRSITASLPDGKFDSSLPSPVGQQENEKKLATLSVLFPIFFASIFSAVEVYTNFALLKESCAVVAWDWHTLADIWYILASIINGHFVSSLMVSACFALLQQYLLFIPVGLDDNKSIGLLMASFFYLSFYVMYLAQSKPITLNNVLPVYSAVYFFIIWFSLKRDVRQVIIRPFIGYR